MPFGGRSARESRVSDPYLDVHDLISSAQGEARRRVAAFANVHAQNRRKLPLKVRLQHHRVRSAYFAAWSRVDAARLERETKQARDKFGVAFDREAPAGEYLIPKGSEDEARIFAAYYRLLVFSKSRDAICDPDGRLLVAAVAGVSPEEYDEAWSDVPLDWIIATVV